MPIGSGIVYNTGDLILSQVSSSGTAFLETKIAAATSSLIYFDSTARINSASLNSITVGTASYVSGSTSIIMSRLIVIKLNLMQLLVFIIEIIFC